MLSMQQHRYEQRFIQSANLKATIRTRGNASPAIKKEASRVDTQRLVAGHKRKISSIDGKTGRGGECAVVGRELMTTRALFVLMVVTLYDETCT